ncbi:MAG: Excisionase-like protein [Candidatus Accumulibacter vicinus]|uniref:Excisionase-like protein n=1 Tax=Candidatus Accumulibacter vicinus TaxID=2954382 RepID=A0A084XV09_9PROT|nr:MAG: Excisionase-like protein [Candidatus Accumulibacter vicinus]
MPPKLIPVAHWSAARFDPPASAQMLRRWCRQGKIPGAVRIGREWRVPVDAEYQASVSESNELMRLIYGRQRSAA